MKNKSIEKLEKLTLRESGMRFTSERELIMCENGVEVSQYEIRYTKNGDERILIKRGSTSKEAALKLLNDCKIMKWDGFSGAHPRFVKDGIMFSLTAVVNDGKVIRAEGSQNFPKRYREFTDGLNGLLNGSI